MYNVQQSCAAFICVDFDVIIVYRVGRKEPEHTLRFQVRVITKFSQHFLRIGEQFFRFLTDSGVFENTWKLALELLGMKKRRPVDKRHQVLHGYIIQNLNARNVRFDGTVTLPVKLQFVVSGILDTQQIHSI